MSIIEIEVSDECEHKNCSHTPYHAYYINGQAGENGIGVYCQRHSRTFAQPRDTHEYLSEISLERVSD